MRILPVIAVGLGLSLMPARADTPSSAATAAGTCSGKKAKACEVSRQDLKKAREAFKRGLRLKDVRPQEALSAFTEAMHLVPRDAQYVSTRELFLQQMVYDHIQRGNQLLSQGERRTGLAEFRAALELDPGNRFAAQRLLDASDAPLPARPTYTEPQWDAQESLPRPKPGQQTLHLRTDTRGAYTTIGSAFGIKVRFDSSTRATSIHLDLDQVTFEQAMNAVALVTHSFWAAVSHSEVLVAADNPAKRKELERWLLRTFYLPEISSPQELNEIATLLRTLFDLHNVTQSSSSGTLTVRGPAPAVLTATQFLQTLRAERPQVMIDFEVYQVTREMLRDAGISLPEQFSVFPVSQSAVSVTRSGATSLGSVPVAALISQAQQQPVKLQAEQKTDSISYEEELLQQAG